MERYREVATRAAEKMQAYREDLSGWRSCKRTNEVSVSWKPSTEFHGNIYKAEGILPAKPEAVFKCIKPEAGGLREKWDKNVKELLIIENICITRTITPSALMKIISPRDFLDVVLIKQDEDGTILSAATNVEHPQCPPEPGYVRGRNYPCGCFCIPVPGDSSKTQLFSFFQSDLCGNLPHSIVDSFFASSIAEFHSNLTKAVKTLVA
ncbi:PREDICTED: stAR-related lipid transfer protein 5 isoform X2 [Gekko japonicus]|uniref:StAR-related lipid transfer protein 5 isoform X2 n=1 Tax=Gekko japonicus TaxID=146911 RepID=A0ABM1JHE6_GEKJA|nr:PREDICTED: stAR-related lipid transfer protein 5 isoform X2 [Gekko japonicus]